MKLVMAMKVRDEDDVLEHNLRYHRAHGVDHFVVTDNGSTDGTPEILRRFESDGVLTLIEEPATEDFRDEAHWWVTRMARIAATDLDADWVVHADADEFWSPVSGTLKEAFDGIPAEYGVMLAPRPEFVARPDGPGRFWERMTVREARSRLRPKVAHRAEPDAVLHRGAHDVDVERDEGGSRHSGRAVMRAVKDQRAAGADPLVWAPVFPARVLHFPLRSLDQYRRKVEVSLRGGFDDKAHDELREAYEQRRLPELYASLAVDDAAVEAGLADGTLVEDTTVRDVLATSTPAESSAGASGSAGSRAGRASDVEAELAELRLDAMRTLARTQRSLIRQLDNFRRRVDKQRRKIAQAERSRGLGRLRSGAARRLRRRRS
ncbi:MAG TPA: glycosyltransferase family 2 protein [Solirubrobacterales bacterium]|nr:glycosyltransferase family 2 protein [Solirubrobacterales bacterium]